MWFNVFVTGSAQTIPVHHTQPIHTMFDSLMSYRHVPHSSVKTECCLPSV